MNERPLDPAGPPPALPPAPPPFCSLCHWTSPHIHLGLPRILCSQPRDQTWVSNVAGRFFTISTTWEVPLLIAIQLKFAILIQYHIMLIIFGHIYTI